MIKNTDREYIHGVMVASTVVNGKMVNSMVKEYTDMLMVVVEQVFGKKVSVQLGWMKNEV
jgi:hypothetical protein